MRHVLEQLKCKRLPIPSVGDDVELKPQKLLMKMYNGETTLENI